MISYFRKGASFLAYTLILYSCYIISGIYHEKILKRTYLNINNASQEYFEAPIVFTLFPPLASTIIGFAILTIQKRQKQNDLDIPFSKSLTCSAVITLNMWTYNKAVVTSSFSTSIMVKSCSLLSVILVAVFCSRVKEKGLKLTRNKIWIGLAATLGIFLFNYFKINEQSNDQPLNWLGLSFLLVSLLGDGFLPDLQAQIKSKFNPSAIEMYYSINKATALLALIYSVVTFQYLYIFDFITTHQEIQLDILIFSTLNALGQLVIYQMVKAFKQHIPAFVIATRKCFTVIVNILYFHHQVNYLQIFGLIFVFSAVMMEVYSNFKEKQSQVQQVPTTQIEQDQSFASQPIGQINNAQNIV